jgi:hypothetical protein
MNLRRWLSVILVMGVILALSSLGAQADPYGPYEPYHRPHGHAYGWDGPRHHDYGRHQERGWRSCRGPHNPHYVERVYEGPPSVTYVTPVAPVMGIPYVPPQPYFSQPSQPAPLGLHGQFNYGF